MNNFNMGAAQATSDLKESIGRLESTAVSNGKTLIAAFRRSGTVVREFMEGHPGRMIVASLALGMVLGALGRSAARNGMRSGR